MADNGRELGRVYEEGEVIFRQGDPARCLYVIQKGKVEIFMESEYGSNHLTTLKKGDVFGEISLFAGKARFATARTLQKSRILTIDENNFIAKLHQDPSLAFRLIRKMANRIYDQDHELMRGYFDETQRSQQAVGFASYIDLQILIEEESKRSRRLWQTMAYVLLDIDDFDLLSERYGHSAGESLLQSLAEILREHLRRRDLIGRFGSDRFGLLLYEGDGQAAVRVMEKVRQSFNTLWAKEGDDSMRATFSCGIATFPEYEDPTKLSKAAYRALVSSKKEGKNRVVLADPPDRRRSRE